MGEPGHFRLSGRQNCSWGSSNRISNSKQGTRQLGKEWGGTAWYLLACLELQTRYASIVAEDSADIYVFLHLSDFWLVLNHFSNPYNKNIPLEVDELEMSAVGLILFPSPLFPQILLMIFRNFRYWVSYDPNLFRLPGGKLSTVTAQINKFFHSSSQ